MWEEVGTQLLQLFVTVLVAVFGLLCAFAVQYINRLSENLQEKTDNEFAERAIRRLENIAVMTVEALEQQVAEDLREKVKEGKVDREMLLALKDSAVDTIKATAGRETLEALEGTFGDVEEYIRNLTEQVLRRIKGGN